MYTLEIRDEVCIHTEKFEKKPTQDEISEACEKWVNDGDWSEFPDGLEVTVWWELSDADGDEIDYDYEIIDILPDHESLIRAAAKGKGCGNNPEDHEWESTVEIEGGLRQNPGVWSLGGTTVLNASHCCNCGLRRKITEYGAQRNPGQIDTTTYSYEDVEEEVCE